MWWKLGGLAAATGAILILLFVPTPFTPTTSVRIKVDLPPGMQNVSGAQVLSSVETAAWIFEFIIVAAILAIAGWIAWRIVRHHRKAN